MPKRTAVRFTKEVVKGFACPENKNQAFLYFIDPAGLGIRATRTSKSWIYRGVNPKTGQDMRVTLAPYSSVGYQRASEMALELSIILSRGVDPREKEREEQQQRIAELSRETLLATPLRALWDEYIKAKSAKWSELHLRDHHQHSRQATQESPDSVGYLAKLLELQVSAITATQVREHFESFEKRGASLSNAFRLFCAFLNWCNQHDDFAGTLPAPQQIKQKTKGTIPRPRVKQDHLQKEQLQPWFREVRAISNPYISSYLQICLLTGARRNEPLGLTWADVDFKWKTVGLNDKVEGSRTIPLTPYVESLLRTLFEISRLTAGEEAILPTSPVFRSPTAASGVLAEPTKAHKQALKRADIGGLTIHGLRRSFSSLREWVEMPLGIDYQITGQKSSATVERHYKRRPIDLLRHWHTKFETWILNEAGIEKVIDTNTNEVKTENE